MGAYYTTSDRVLLFLILVLPIVSYYFGVLHTERRIFSAYEQARLNYSRNRLRNL